MTLYLAIPAAAKYYLNHYVLNDMGRYTGSVDRVQVRLFEGAYQLKKLNIHLKEKSPQQPFFSTDSLDISVSWLALRKGELLVNAQLSQPQLNLLDSQSNSDQQVGEGTNWLAVLEEILPTTLNQLGVKNGSIHFANEETSPKVDILLTDIDAEISNLTNVKDQSGRRVATAKLKGMLFSEIPVQANAEFDPFQHDDFMFAGKTGSIPLRKLNDFSKAYGNIDFKSGHIELYSEIEADAGKISGYVKPLMEDVNIASWQQDVVDQGDNPFQLTWESLMGFLGQLFTNLETDKLATEIEVEGTLNDTRLNSWQAAWGIVKNAFVEAVESRFNQLTPLTDDSE